MVADSIEAVLDGYLLRTEKPRPPDGRFHPSSIFGCERLATYEVRGVPQTDEKTPQNRRILRIGTHLGEILQAAMEDDPSVLATYSEVALSMPELNVKGSCDALRQLSVDEWELVEDKTISSKGFRYAPKADHIQQARAYAMALRRHGGIWHYPDCSASGNPAGHDGPCVKIEPLGDSLQKIRMVYWSKDDLKIAEFEIDVDEQWEADFEVKMSYLLPYREGTALPSRLPLDIHGEKNWLCRYCSWRTKCWEVDSEGEEE